MSARFRRLLALIVAVTCMGCAARAQDQDKNDELPPQLNIERLLAGPDRKDLRCDLELDPARLTFQQRNLVHIKADVDPSADERKDALELYFVLKVADSSGKWLPEERHRRFNVPAGFNKDSLVEYSGGFYAKPGKYTLALIVFDATSGKSDVIRKPFEVKPPKNDPLPQLDRDLPTIDFVANPPAEQPVRTGDHYGRRGIRPPEFSTVHPEDDWPPGQGKAYLPVHNTRPLLVDVILNVAPPADSGWRSTTQSQYRAIAGAMLQAGAAISSLGIENGCVEVSGIDLAQLQVVFERMPARDADWNKLAKAVDKRNNATVSVAALGNKSATGEFLGKYVSKIASSAAECGEATRGTEHAVLFVSANFSFPSGTHGTHVELEPGQTVRYFLVRVSRAGGGDDLVHFFKPADPQRFDASSPEEFRAVLAQLVAALSGQKN